MHVLLIEDDQFKQEQIERAIRQIDSRASITLARSVQQAVKGLRLRRYDRVILDMALPSHEARAGGAQPISQLTGGIEVLLELSYDGRADPVIIVTQYPEIEFEGRLHSLVKAKQVLAKSVSANVIDVIYFTTQGGNWQEQFGKALS